MSHSPAAPKGVRSAAGQGEGTRVGATRDEEEAPGAAGAAKTPRATLDSDTSGARGAPSPFDASDGPQASKAAVSKPKPRHPASELLARYRAVFGAAWAHRAELAGPKRLADEAAFLPAALSLQHTPVHPAPRRVAYVLMALFLAAVAWACFGKVDIVAVAPGRIIVSDRTKLVQPLENAIVQRILVKDGDHVRADQPLVELDPTSASADKTSVQEALKSAQSEGLRARALLRMLDDPGQLHLASARVALVLPASWSAEEQGAVQAQLDAERSDIAARWSRLAAEARRRQAEIATVREMIAKLEETVPLSRRREDDFMQLSAQGFIAHHAGQDRTRERIELERDLATQRARLQEGLANLAETESARAAYLAETRRALAEREAGAELKRQQAVQEHAKATRREKLTTLTAPVAGVVQQLAVHTAGGVVTEAQPLMVIVPDEADSALVAEVTLENKDSDTCTYALGGGNGSLMDTYRAGDTNTVELGEGVDAGTVRLGWSGPGNGRGSFVLTMADGATTVTGPPAMTVVGSSSSWRDSAGLQRNAVSPRRFLSAVQHVYHFRGMPDARILRGKSKCSERLLSFEGAIGALQFAHRKNRRKHHRSRGIVLNLMDWNDA